MTHESKIRPTPPIEQGLKEINYVFVISYTIVNYPGNSNPEPTTKIEGFGLEEDAMKRFEEIIIGIANDTGFDIQDYLDLLAREDEERLQELEEDFDGVVIIGQNDVYIHENYPEREYHLKLEKIVIQNSFIPQENSDV